MDDHALTHSSHALIAQIAFPLTTFGTRLSIHPAVINTHHEKQVNDIDSNAHDVYQELFRLKASLEVAPIPEDPAAIALHLKHMRLANRSAFDDVVDLGRLKSAIARCMSAATDSSRLNQNRMIKEQALEALHMDIRMRQHVPRRLKPQPKVTSQW